MARIAEVDAGRSLEHNIAFDTGKGITNRDGSASILATASAFTFNFTIDLDGPIDQDVALTAAGDAINSATTINHATASVEGIDLSITQLTTARTSGIVSAYKATLVGLAGDTGGTYIGLDLVGTPAGGTNTFYGMRLDAGWTAWADLSALATGEADIIIGDNLASAFEIREGANSYITVVTTNSSEAVKVDKTLDLNALLDQDVASTGAVSVHDIDATINHATAVYVGVDTSVAQVTTPRTGGTVTAVKGAVTSLSGDTVGVDYYAFEASVTVGEANADHFAFKVNAGFDGVLDLSACATGEADVIVGDNLASAFEIREGANTYVRVNTTNSGEAVEVTGLRTLSVTAGAITGTTVLTLRDSGGVFSVSQGAAYDIDLPSPTTGPGCRYLFYLTGAAANNVTITVAGAAATFVGTIVNDVTSVLPATGSTLTFASGVAALGDNIEIVSISTTLYLVRAVSSVNGGITIA